MSAKPEDVNLSSRMEQISSTRWGKVTESAHGAQRFKGKKGREGASSRAAIQHSLMQPASRRVLEPYKLALLSTVAEAHVPRDDGEIPYSANRGTHSGVFNKNGLRRYCSPRCTAS